MKIRHNYFKFVHSRLEDSVNFISPIQQIVGAFVAFEAAALTLHENPPKGLDWYLSEYPEKIINQ